MKRIFSLVTFLLLACSVSFAEDIRAAGSTSQCFTISVGDSSVNTGIGLSGIAFNTAGLSCSYFRNETAAGEVRVAITLASSTLGTYTSGAFKEIDATNMKGVYEFCPPDASLASGAAAVFYHCFGVTNMTPMNLRVLLGPGITVASGGITTGSFAAGAIDASAVAADAIGASEIAADAIGASELAADSIGSSEVATGAIDTTALAASSITATSIAADAITNAKIANDAIGATEVADGAIDAATLAADTITAAKIAADSIGASEIAAGAITSSEAPNLDAAISSISAGASTVISSGTAQAVTATTAQLAAAEAYGNNVLADNASVVIDSATTGKGQTRCIKSNVLSTDTVTLIAPWTITPTGTVTYRVTATPNCNPAKWPSSH